MATKRGQQEADETEDSTESTVDRLANEVLINATGDVPDEIEPEEDDDDDGPPQPQRGAPGTRDGKRNTKWAEHTEARRVAEDRAERAERELAEERAARVAVQTMQQQQQPAQQQNPLKVYDDAEVAIQQEIERHRSTYQKMDPKKVNDADQQAFHQRWGELDGQLQQVRINRAIQHDRLQNQRSQPDPRVAAAANFVRTNHPDLADDPETMQYVHGLVSQKMAVRNKMNRTPGAPATMTDLKEALEEAARKFGQAPARPKTPQRAAAYSGLPTGPVRGTTKKPGTLDMRGDNGKLYHKMAMARWPDLYHSNPAKALAKLAKDIGPEDEPS